MSAPTVSSLRITVGASLLTIALAACGGGGSGGANAVASLSGTKGSSGGKGATTRSDDPADVRKQLLAHALCMQDNGVTDYPDPESDANGRPEFHRDRRGSFDDLRNRAGFAKAQIACESKRPDFAGQFQRTPEEQAAQRNRLLAFAHCMRGQGIDFPDPTFDANGRPQFGDHDGGPGGGQGRNRDDPAAQTARDACREERGDTFRGGHGDRGPGAVHRPARPDAQPA